MGGGPPAAMLPLPTIRARETVVHYRRGSGWEMLLMRRLISQDGGMLGLPEMPAVCRSGKTEQPPPGRKGVRAYCRCGEGREGALHLRNHLKKVEGRVARKKYPEKFRGGRVARGDGMAHRRFLQTNLNQSARAQDLFVQSLAK